jgi:fatty acid desaturase
MTDKLSLIDVQRHIRKDFSKEQVQEWMKPSAYRVVVDLLVDWSVITAAFIFFVYFGTWWSAVLAFVVIGCCQYRLFILGHDALHGNLSTARRRNNFMARWLVYSPMFMDFGDAQRNHLNHHQLLGTAQDPDRYIHIIDNKNSVAKFLLFCSGLATFGKTVLKVSPFGRKVSPAAQKVDEKAAGEKGELKDYIIARIPVMIWQLAIVSVFWMSGIWWAYPLLWIAPIYFLVFLPDEIRAFCDHAIIDLSSDETDADRLVTFNSNPLERLFFSPHNMNFHAEHHLWVGIPYYNLPAVHKVVKEIPEVTVRGSYLGFLSQVLRRLPVRASEPVRVSGSVRTPEPVRTSENA